MVTMDQAFAYTQSLLRDLPEREEKLELLKQHTEDGLFWNLLKCFLVGFEYQAVLHFIETAKPKNREEVNQWMFQELTTRLQDKDKLYKEIVDLKKDVESARKLRDDYERSLQEIQKLKLENKNMLQTVSQKDILIRQLQEKMKKASEEPGNQLQQQLDANDGGKLYMEAFKQEVLLNKGFSPEQKDYLFSLLEKGEKYSRIRMIASPDIVLNDMKRFYALATTEEAEENLLDKVKGWITKRREKEE